MAAGDQGHGLLIVHGHPPERLADVAGRRQRVRTAVGPLGVHVDETHLDGGQRVGELAVAAVALVCEPGVLGAPVDVLGLPGVLAPAAKAERLKAHRLQRAVAGEDHEVGPGDLAAVRALDRPQQAARLVEVGVVRPAVQRGEPLRARARATAPVAHAVRAGAMPGHADEQRAVVAVVGRPPLLRVRHQGKEVAPHGREVEGGKLGGVVEVRPQRVGRRRVAVQHRQVELVGPPLPDLHLRGHAADRVRALVGHDDLSSHGSGRGCAGRRALRVLVDVDPFIEAERDRSDNRWTAPIPMAGGPESVSPAPACLVSRLARTGVSGRSSCPARVRRSPRVRVPTARASDASARPARRRVPGRHP